MPTATRIPTLFPTVAELAGHVRALATLRESEAPMVSAYLDLSAGRERAVDRLAARSRDLLAAWPPAGRELLETALARLRFFLLESDLGLARGVALFARAGRQPYFLDLAFAVPVEERIAAGSLPSIYGLAALKDTFDRFLVVVAQPDVARIYDVQLGAVSERLLVEQPALRERVGEEWSRLRYQNHRRERDRRFLAEKVAVLDRLAAGAGRSHIILAGDPARIAALRAELPRHLADRVIDAVPLPSGASEEQVVAATLEPFIAAEEAGSRALLDELLQAWHRQDPAVAGTAATLQVLARGQADALVVAADWQPGPVRACPTCGWAAEGWGDGLDCPECGGLTRAEPDGREVAARLAEASGCRIEVVAEPSPLDGLGGVGCLLRYRPWPTGA